MSTLTNARRAPRLNRRQLAGGGGAGALALLVAGCSRGSNTERRQAGSAGGPRRDGTLTVSHDFNRGFDPHVLQVTETGIMGLFYSQLVRANPKTYGIEPDLAAKWETPSSTEIILTLAPKVRWQNKPPLNGRALKADDVAYSLTRIRASDPAFINRSYLSSIARVETTDAQAIKITLNAPDVTQLGNLANASVKILAPEVVEGAGKFATAETAVGTGAFSLQDSQPNIGSTLARNPDYFKPGLPYLEGVELKAFSDLSTEWSAFVGGRLASRWVPGDQVATFQKEPSSRYGRQWEADTGWHIGMPMTVKPPFNDARVTRALRLLIDHNEIKNNWSTTWVGRGRIGSFAAATGEAGWDLSEDEYGEYLEWKQPKDEAVREAVSLLSAAGFTPDKPLRYTLATTTQQSEDALVQLVQDQLKRNSQGAVTPELRTYETAAYTALRTNGQFEYYMSGQQVGGVDPDAYFTSTYQTGAGRNYGKMSDSKLDQMIAKQRTILDLEQRKLAIRDLVTYMIDHSPYPSLIGSYFLTATQGNVKDFPPEGNTFQWGDHYESVWGV